MDYLEIIKLIKEKNEAGIENLFHDYATKLYQYAVQQWQQSEDDAWEAVYKTMHTLLIKLPDYEIESALHFNNLIFKIFKNNLRQCFRDRRNKEGKVEFFSIERLSNESDVNFSVNHNLFEDYYQNEVIESPLFIALKKALEYLPDDDKELLLLKAQNYSYNEIANMLGIENNQLKVKHHRAKKKLIELINEQHVSIYE